MSKVRHVRWTIDDILSVIRAVWPDPPRVEESEIIAVELGRVHQASLQDEHGDVLETISRSNKDYTREDICWAAEAFCRQVIPHILGGGNLTELIESDKRVRQGSRLRQLAPVWKLYLGPQMPCVGVSPEKKICLEFGRHRTRAAQEVGLDVLPMVTHPREIVEMTPDDKNLPELKSYDDYIGFLGSSAYS